MLEISWSACSRKYSNIKPLLCFLSCQLDYRRLIPQSQFAFLYAWLKSSEMLGNAGHSCHLLCFWWPQFARLWLEMFACTRKFVYQKNSKPLRTEGSWRWSSGGPENCSDSAKSACFSCLSCVPRTGTAYRLPLRHCWNYFPCTA